jgi:hypothetical protein
MRTLFWILLLANVILFAVMQRGGLNWGEPPYLAQPALHEENIRLLNTPPAAPTKASPVPSPAATPSASAQVPSTPQAVIPAPATTSAPLANPASPVPAPPRDPAPAVKQTPTAKTARQEPLVCLEWGDFSGTDLKRATEILAALQLGDRLRQRQIEYNKGYWVYIPPLKTKAAASKKVSQIKKMGIREYFVVQEVGALRYAISLGVFKTQEAARNYLGELNAKGLRSAKVGERASKLKTTMFMLNSVDASIEGKLMAARKDLPGSNLKNVPCALTK